MKKILVIRMSAIGDIVLATSFLESVKQKYPDSEIHFLIKKEFSDLVQKQPIIDKLISFDKKLGKPPGLITIRLHFDGSLSISERSNDYNLKCKEINAITISVTENMEKYKPTR